MFETILFILVAVLAVAGMVAFARRAARKTRLDKEAVKRVRLLGRGQAIDIDLWPRGKKKDHQ